MLFITACAPSTSQIQTSIAQTQAVWTPIPTQTAFPTIIKVITQTQTDWTPTATQTAVPTVVIIIVQTPTPAYSDTLCKPIENMSYENMWKSIAILQAYVNQFEDVKQTTYAVPEPLYSNTLSYLVHIEYVSKTDGKTYSRRYIVYFKEFSWLNAIYSIDGQCFIDPPHS